MRTATANAARPWLLLAALGGCGALPGALDPGAGVDATYARQVQPLLVENGFLAERVLLLAARVYNEPDGPAAELAATWSGDVVPLAEHLHHQATFVAPPPEWADRHEALVDLWADRADAYRALGESIVRADAAGWQAARALADDVKLREEAWFRDVNGVLGPKGLSLDQFP